MKARLLAAACALSCGITAPVEALPGSDGERVSGGGSVSLPPYLQCVPFARQATGMQIRGDAHTWWGQAAGRYARGTLPRVGAVMNFRPHGNSRLGHVAAVSRIIDSRTVLVSHANWSLINGRRGQIERDVRVVDASPRNDWSRVRVWYGPNKALGTTHWPLYGFIYNHKPGAIPRAASRLADGAARIAERAPAPAWSDDPIGDIIAKRRARR